MNVLKQSLPLISTVSLSIVEKTTATKQNNTTMSSGLASPQSFVEHSSTALPVNYQTVQAPPWLSSVNTTTYRQPQLPSSPSPLVNRNCHPMDSTSLFANGSTSVASSPTISTAPFNSGLFSNIASRATTPTMMTTYPTNLQPTSPPPLQTNQRRLSLLASSDSRSASFTSDTYSSSSSHIRNDPILENSLPSLPNGATLEIEYPTSLPSLATIAAAATTHINNYTIESNTLGNGNANTSSNPGSFVRQTLLSADSRAVAVAGGHSAILASISVNVTNPSSEGTGRSFLEARRASLISAISQSASSREVRNSTDAAERIARNRSRAEQAASAADAEEAAAAAASFSLLTPAVSSRRRSSKLTTSSQSAVDSPAVDDFNRRLTRSNAELAVTTGSLRSKRTHEEIQVDDHQHEESDIMHETETSQKSKKLKRAVVSTRKKAPSPTRDEGEVTDKCHATNCPICMSVPSREEISVVDGCSHNFCFACIGKWAERENSCPLCKSRFTKISRVHMQRRKGKTGTPICNIKRVKQRDQRSDIVAGAALESLLASFPGVPFPPGMNGRLFMATPRGFLPMLHQHEQRLQRRSARAHTIDNVLDSSSEDEETPGFLDLMNILSQRRDSRLVRDDVSSSARINIAGRSRSEPHPLYSFGSIPSISTDSTSTPAGLPQSLFSFRPSLRSAATSLYRSYASNVSDPSAGQGASNPLEIDDDSDADDSVELLHVVSTATSSI